MTVTRPSEPNNPRKRRDANAAIRRMHAVRGLLLAAAALVTAVTGLIVAITRH